MTKLWLIIDRYDDSGSRVLAAFNDKSEANEIALELNFENAYIDFCRTLIQCQKEVAPYNIFDHKYRYRNEEVIPSDEEIALTRCDARRYCVISTKGFFEVA